MVARDAIRGYYDPGYVPAMGACLVSWGVWLLGPGMVIRGLRGGIAVPSRGRDSRRAAFPGRRGSVGRWSRDVRRDSLPRPSTTSHRCRSECIICGTCQWLVDTVLAIGLAIGTCWLFIVALDLTEMSAPPCFPFSDENVVPTLRRRQKEHASTARLRGRPDAVVLLPDFGLMSIWTEFHEFVGCRG